MKVNREHNPYDSTDYIDFSCPGCKLYHVLPVTGPRSWKFNNNLESPTITPSILATRNMYTGPGTPPKKEICHSFVTDGKIQFLSDCTHELVNQTVDLLEI